MTGCRRLWALITGLPPDCALARDGRAWTTAMELASRQIENESMWLAIVAKGLGMKKLPPLESIRHPARIVIEAPSRKTTDTREIAAFFGRMN